MRAGMPADQDEAPLGAPAPSPAGVFGKRLGESSRASVSVDRIGPTHSAIRDDGPAPSPAGFCRTGFQPGPRASLPARSMSIPWHTPVTEASSWTGEPS